MRLGLGAGAIAALTVMIGGMVRFPVGDSSVAAEGVAAGDAVTAAAAPAREVRIQKKVRYIQLKRGQKAPPGAKVIDGAQPTPRVVVTRIRQAAPRTVPKKPTKTRQSGG